MLGGLGQFRQVFSTAINPTQAAELKALQSANLAAVTSGNVDTFHASDVASFRSSTLPAQLRDIQKGQSAHFQKKTVEYYKTLVSEGKINPKTVTADEFINKAEVLAKHDPLSLGWAEIAAKLHAFNVVGHTLLEGNHERAERADALHQLQQVREIGMMQAEARQTALGKDQMLVSPAALAVARQRAGR